MEKPQPAKKADAKSKDPITYSNSCDGDPLCAPAAWDPARSLRKRPSPPVPQKAAVKPAPQKVETVAPKPVANSKATVKGPTVQAPPPVAEYGRAAVANLETPDGYGYSFGDDNLNGKTPPADNMNLRQKRKNGMGCLHKILPMSSPAYGVPPDVAVTDDQGNLVIDEDLFLDESKWVDKSKLRQNFKDALLCLDPCRTESDAEFLLDCVNWDLLDSGDLLDSWKNFNVFRVKEYKNGPTGDLIRRAFSQDFVCGKSDVARALQKGLYQRRILDHGVCQGHPIRLEALDIYQDFDIAALPPAPRIAEYEPEKVPADVPPKKESVPPQKFKNPPPPVKEKPKTVIKRDDGPGEDTSLNHKTDIVLLIDNSPSMHKNHIGEKFVEEAVPAILQKLHELALSDSRLIVTSQNFSGKPKVYGVSDPDLGAKVAAQVAGYFKFQGDGYERPLEVLRVQLQGLVRPDASVVILVLTDEEDSSPISAKNYVKFYNKLTSQKVTVSSTAPSDPKKTTPFNGLFALHKAAELSGGRSLEFNREQVAQAAKELVEAGQSHELVLRYTPDQVIGVTRNGVELSPDEYKIDRMRGTVVLLNQPRPGDRMRVQYKSGTGEIDDNFNYDAGDGRNASDPRARFFSEADEAPKASESAPDVTVLEVENGKKTAAPKMRAPTPPKAQPAEVEKAPGPVAKPRAPIYQAPRVPVAVKRMHELKVLFQSEAFIDPNSVRVSLNGTELREGVQVSQSDGALHVTFPIVQTDEPQSGTLTYAFWGANVADLRAAMAGKNEFKLQLPPSLTPMEQAHVDMMKKCTDSKESTTPTTPYAQWSKEEKAQCSWSMTVGRLKKDGADNALQVEHASAIGDWIGTRLADTHAGLSTEEARVLLVHFPKFAKEVPSVTLNAGDATGLLSAMQTSQDVATMRMLLRLSREVDLTQAIQGVELQLLAKYSNLLYQQGSAEDRADAQALLAYLKPVGGDCKKALKPTKNDHGDVNFYYDVNFDQAAESRDGAGAFNRALAQAIRVKRMVELGNKCGVGSGAKAKK